MRYFITGSTGFIGAHLVERLLREGHEVVGLVRTPAKAEHLIAKGMRVLQGDLSRFADPQLTLEPVDVVVHLAAVVTARSLDQYEAINFDAVRDLLACLERQDWKPKRLLFASSLAAAGPSVPGTTLREDDPLNPIEPYGASKARSEALLAGASFPVTSFRPPVVIGPRDPAFLPVFQGAKRGLGFRVAGPPQRLSFVAVDDLVDALVLMAEDTRPGKRVFFTPHPDVVDILDVWRAVGDSVGRDVFVAALPTWALKAASRVLTAAAKVLPFTNPLDDKQVAQLTAPAYVCSADKLRDELGWTPHVDLAEAARRAAEGYRADGWL